MTHQVLLPTIWTPLYININNLKYAIGWFSKIKNNWIARLTNKYKNIFFIQSNCFIKWLIWIHLHVNLAFAWFANISNIKYFECCILLHNLLFVLNHNINSDVESSSLKEKHFEIIMKYFRIVIYGNINIYCNIRFKRKPFFY